MGRTSLQDLRSLGDPLQQWNFDVVFPRFPAAGNARDMTYKAMSTNIPGAGLDKVATDLHGVSLQYAGRAIYTHTWTCTFLETRDMGTRNKFLNWKELARSWTKNSGTYKDVYSTTIQLLLYDDIPQVVRTVLIYGAFPETVGDSPLDGATSAAVTTEVTFSFDYVDDSAA